MTHAGGATVPAARAPGRTGYVPTLDGWRAIAILAVILGHALRGGRCGDAEAPAWCNVGLLGGHGVAIFFGISGFIITSRLIDESRLRGEVSLRSFYVRRGFRILPPALAYLLVIGLLGAVGRVENHTDAWLGSIFFMRDYVGFTQPNWYTAHFWSLAIEEKFYFIWPVLVASLTAKRLARGAAALALMISAWRIADGHWHLLSGADGLPTFTIALRSDTRFDALLLGCIAALALATQAGRAWWRDQLTASARAGIGLLFVLAVVVYPSRASAGLLLETFVVPLMLLATILHPASVIGRTWEHRAMRWIGLRSYSLYLWQQLFLPEHGHVDFPLLQHPAVALPMIFATAALSYRYIEQPLTRVGHRLSARWARTPALSLPLRMDAEADPTALG